MHVEQAAVVKPLHGTTLARKTKDPPYISGDYLC